MHRPLASGSVLFALTLLLSPSALAEDPEPGSVLVYPSVRSGTAGTTIINVSNVDLAVDGSTNVKFDFVNVTPQPGDPLNPAQCTVFNITRFLTPGDNLTFLTTCLNPTSAEGYLVAQAQDPQFFDRAWSHDFLVGSETTVSGTGAVLTLGATSFHALPARHVATDLDGDNELDFDNLEYTAAPQVLYLDSFLASLGNKLCLIPMTGGFAFQTEASITIFNDNEQPFSDTIEFTCWFDQRLENLSGFFSLAFLINSANDPTEWDIDCDGTGDLEAGWAQIRGLQATSTLETSASAAIIGAVTGTNQPALERGRPLWRTGDDTSGDFFKFGPDDPEI